jgi:hypothetical protein
MDLATTLKPTTDHTKSIQTTRPHRGVLHYDYNIVLYKLFLKKLL